MVPSEQLNQEMYTAEPLVVGNPMAPSLVFPNPAAEREITVVADLLNVKPLVGTAATKERFLQHLSLAESIHLAANVSWEIVLAPKTNYNESSEDSSRRMIIGRISGEGATMSLRGVTNGAVSSVPSPAEYILSCLLRNLSSVVVTNQSKDTFVLIIYWLFCRHFSGWGSVCSDSVCGPTVATHPDILYAFYSSLLQGSRTSRGMCYAMQVSITCVCTHMYYAGRHKHL